MDLREKIRIATPECFVCRWAGKHIILWPQIPTQPPENHNPRLLGRPTDNSVDNMTSGKWDVYANVHEKMADVGGNRSGHKVIEACPTHWFELAHNWQLIAKAEVDLDDQWWGYVERLERDGYQVLHD